MSTRFDPTTLADDLAPLIDHLRPLVPSASNSAQGMEERFASVAGWLP